MNHPRDFTDYIEELFSDLDDPDAVDMLQYFDREGVLTMEEAYRLKEYTDSVCPDCGRTTCAHERTDVDEFRCTEDRSDEKSDYERAD